MSNLRDLLIGIGFQFDDGALQNANDATDTFVSQIETGDTLVSELGDTAQETSDILSGGMDMSAESASNVADNISDVGDSAEDAGREGSSAFSDFSASIEEVGTTAVAVAGLIGTAFASSLYDAGSSLEAARQRIAWYTSDSEEDFNALHDAIADTVAMSGGLYSEGELLEATAKALKLGTDPQLIANNMEAIGIEAAKHGEDISNVMLQIGRAVEVGSVRRLMEMGVVTEDMFTAMGKEMSQSIRDWDRYEREQLINIALQDVVNENMEEFGDFMQTNEGQMQRLNSEIGNVMEIMSDPILSPMVLILENIAHFLQFMQANPIGNATLQLGGVLSILASMIVAVAGVLAVLIKIGATLAPFFAEGSMLAGAWSTVMGALTAVIGALSGEIIAIVAIIAGLIFIIQDLYTYLRGGDSLIGRFEQRFGLLGKAIVRAVFPVIGFVEGLRELYSVLQDLYTLATEIDMSNIWAKIGISTEDNSTGISGTSGINTGEAPILGATAVSSNLNGIKNDFQSSVTVSVSGSNASAEEIGTQVETAMNRSFDSMMDKHMRRMSSVS